MAKAVLELIAKTEGWNGTLKQATNALNNFIKTNGGLHEALAKDGKTMQDAVAKFGTLKTSAMDLSGKVKELSNNYMLLGDIYSQLTKKEKASPFGVETLKQMRLLKSQVLETKTTLNKLNADLSIDDKKFGAFGAIFQGNLAASAAMNAFRELGNGIKYAAQTNIDFEQSNATLASILGTTTDKVIALTENAKMLGATTVWTAGEISELQQVLARRGFNEGQILDMTKGISSLATATGVGLADAAELAASAIQAFQLPASQMDDVVATLGVATTKSALDMEKLRYAFAYVAPAAKAAGFSIEEAVSMLGALADAGLPATTAGMATRNILLDMTDSSSRLAKGLGKPVHSLDEFVAALEELKAKGGNNLETIGKLVDDRVVPAFSVFLNSTDKMVTMREEVTNVRDELQAMVDNQINTLQGSITLLTSAWDGLLLSFSGANTPIRKVVDSITSVINAMTEASNTGKLERSLYNVTTAIQAATAAFITYKVATIDVEMVLLNVGIAFEKLGNRIKKLNALLVKHPWVAVASAIAALTVVAVRNKKAMDEVNKSYNTFGDIEAEVKRQYQEQASKVKMLTEIIHDHNRTLTQRQSAIEHLQSIIPDYHASLSEEKGLYDENRSAIDEYNKALERSIRIDALRNKITELEGNKINITTQLNDYQRQGMTRASELLSDPATVSRLQHLYGMPVGTTALDWQNIQDIDLQNLSRQYEALWNQYFAVDDQLRPLLNKLEELTAEQLTTKTTTTTTTTTTTGGDEEKDKYLDRMLKAEARYANKLELASINIDQGVEEKKDYLKKELAVTEQLRTSYAELYEETKDPKYLDEMKGLAESIKCLRQEIDKQTELEKQAAEKLKQEEAQKKLNEKIYKRLTKYANRPGIGFEAVGLDGVQSKIDLGEAINWQSIIDKLNAYLASDSIKINVDLASGNVEEIKFSLQEALSQFDGKIGAFSTIVNSVDNIKSSFESLTETINSDASVWDKWFATFNFGIGVLQTVISVMQAIETLKEASVLLSEAQIAANTEETATTLADATAKTTDAAAIEASSVAQEKQIAVETAKAPVDVALAETTATLTASQIAQTTASAAQTAANVALAKSSMAAANALIAEAIASIVAKYALIPGGPAISAAEIAALNATYGAGLTAAIAITEMVHFAKGGKVPGALNGGQDTVPAMLSPGEVVLNAAQQSNVAAKLQGAGGQSVMVQGESYVSGEQIRIAYNNYSKRRGVKNQLA